MKIKGYFTSFEIVLWCFSAVLITAVFCIFGNQSYLTLVASLIGVTSLILNAKGNPIGQLLIVIFSLIYGYISYECAYYGEMITYIGMTAPMALFALVSWIRNPYKGEKLQVKVGRLREHEIYLLLILTTAVTLIFYFILRFMGTASLFFSTLSVTTSFVAVYLTARRSEYFALAYASNDIVLIALWISAAKEKLSYISVVICFAVFLINDIYGFVSWQGLKKKQNS